MSSGKVDRLRLKRMRAPPKSGSEGARGDCVQVTPPPAPHYPPSYTPSHSTSPHLTVTYDYRQSSPRDGPLMPMEELAGLFNFKASSMLAPLSLWKDVGCSPTLPARKKTKPGVPESGRERNDLTTLAEMASQLQTRLQHNRTHFTANEMPECRGRLRLEEGDFPSECRGRPRLEEGDSPGGCRGRLRLEEEDSPCEGCRDDSDDDCDWEEDALFWSRAAEELSPSPHFSNQPTSADEFIDQLLFNTPPPSLPAEDKTFRDTLHSDSGPRPHTAEHTALAYDRTEQSHCAGVVPGGGVCVKEKVLMDSTNAEERTVAGLRQCSAVEIARKREEARLRLRQRRQRVLPPSH